MTIEIMGTEIASASEIETGISISNEKEKEIMVVLRQHRTTLHPLSIRIIVTEKFNLVHKQIIELVRLHLQLMTAAPTTLPTAATVFLRCPIRMAQIPAMA